MTDHQQTIKDFEEEYGVKLPTKWEVCGTCRGSGIMVLNHASFSREDFDEDPDFAEDYFSGVYDQPCDGCNGRSTTLDVDEDALGEDSEILRNWRAWLDEINASYQMSRMERMMGA